MTVVGITGTRQGATRLQLLQAYGSLLRLSKEGGLTIHHGQVSDAV